jgi:hypothetical protein
MEVKSPADRPCLDQCSSLPQRCADIGPHESFDPGGDLQLGRRLHLRVHAAERANDLDESIAARSRVQ